MEEDFLEISLKDHFALGRSFPLPVGRAFGPADV